MVAFCPGRALGAAGASFAGGTTRRLRIPDGAHPGPSVLGWHAPVSNSAPDALTAMRKSETLAKKRGGAGRNVLPRSSLTLSSTGWLAAGDERKHARYTVRPKLDTRTAEQPFAGSSGRRASGPPSGPVTSSNARFDSFDRRTSK